MGRLACHIPARGKRQHRPDHALMGDRRGRARRLSDLGEQWGQAGLHLAGALAVGWAQIEPGRFGHYHFSAEPRPQPGEGFALP